jgi:glycerophosphoryl diester phosphodiesterase
MLAAVAAGVDGIISNRPDRFTATFGANPQLN